MCVVLPLVPWITLCVYNANELKWNKAVTSRIFDQIVPQHFSSSAHYTQYQLVQNVLRTYPDMQHIVVESHLPISSYIQSQNITINATDHYRIHNFHQGLREVTSTVRIGLGEFTWAGANFSQYKLSWPQELGGSLNTVYVLLFRSNGSTPTEERQLGEKLLKLAFEWSLNLDQEIWLFSNGRWSKDKKLWKAVQLAERGNLVLKDEFTTSLKRDTETFFSGRELYDSLGIPWKRGLLLLGPPGNGKTESIKVLLKETDKPALYVKSFKSSMGNEHSIRTIFEFARQQAPCILVLEDLDSMVTPDVRSFFLNELDGLEENSGILTIATSNHPEQIDDAILNRPSRFDVKYTFDLPTYELRKQYTSMWIKKAKNVTHMSFNDDFIEEISNDTEGFSFAFMKELFVSYLLRIAYESTLERGPGDPETTMRAQIKQLVGQIKAGGGAQGGGAQEERGSVLRPPLHRTAVLRQQVLQAYQRKSCERDT